MAGIALATAGIALAMAGIVTAGKTLQPAGITDQVLNKKAAFAKAKAAKVELQGIEPWSKHIRRKLSTCLFMHWL